MELKDILTAISELNYEWYIEKKKFFKKEPQFVKKNNHVFVNWGKESNSYFGDETTKTHYFKSYKDEDKTKKIDFNYYCWDSQFENGLWDTNEIYHEDGLCFEHDLPKDVKPILEDLQSYFISRFKGINETNIKALEVIDVMNKVKTAFLTNENSVIKSSIVAFVVKVFFAY